MGIMDSRHVGLVHNSRHLPGTGAELPNNVRKRSKPFNVPHHKDTV